jgi:hypothetical protein
MSLYKWKKIKIANIQNDNNESGKCMLVSRHTGERCVCALENIPKHNSQKRASLKKIHDNIVCIYMLRPHGVILVFAQTTMLWAL